MQNAEISTINNPAPSAVGGISVATLAAALDEQGVTLDRQAPARLLTRYEQCVDYALDSDVGELRLRVSLRSGATQPSGDLGREHEVVSVLHGHLDIVPRPLALHDGRDGDEPSFALFDNSAGVLAVDFPGAAQPAGCQALVDALARALRTVHTAPVEVMSEAGLVPRQAFVRRVLQGWRKRADLVTEHTPPGALMELVDWLEDIGVSDPENLVPVHNQLSLQRILVDATGKGAKQRVSVTSLLDWGACTVGDPLVDLGTLLVGWPVPGDPPELLTLDYVMSSPPALDREAMAAQYAEVTGVNLDDLPFYRVIGLMRAAVFELKRFARVRRGLEPGIVGLDHAEVSECLLDLAMEVSMGRAF